MCNYVICTWLEDNMASRVISWIPVAQHLHKSSVALSELPNLILHRKKVHRSLCTYPARIRSRVQSHPSGRTEPIPSASSFLKLFSSRPNQAVSFSIPLLSLLLLNFIPTVNICCCNHSDNRELLVTLTKYFEPLKNLAALGYFCGNAIIKIRYDVEIILASVALAAGPFKTTPEGLKIDHSYISVFPWENAASLYFLQRSTCD